MPQGTGGRTDGRPDGLRAAGSHGSVAWSVTPRPPAPYPDTPAQEASQGAQDAAAEGDNKHREAGRLERATFIVGPVTVAGRLGKWGCGAAGGARSPVTACVCGPVDLVSERLVASPAEAKQSDSWSLGTPGAGGPGLGAPWPEREGVALAWREQRQRPRLAPGSHLKHLVKNVKALWSQLPRGPWGPADSLGEPVPLEEFSMVSDKTTHFSAPGSCWPFVVCKEGVGGRVGGLVPTAPSLPTYLVIRGGLGACPARLRAGDAEASRRRPIPNPWG